jgi:DNA-directed RNA polymerase III subunit RPC8
MFILSELEDTVKIVPNDFKKEDNGAITDVLNEKYANKVVQEVGLCICVHDILETSEGFILYGDGCSYMKGIQRNLHKHSSSLSTHSFLFSHLSIGCI